MPRSKRVQTARGRLKAFEVKMKQVDATGAETVVSACANCRMSLDDGKQRYQWARKINNLAELVAEHLKD